MKQTLFFIFGQYLILLIMSYFLYRTQLQVFPTSILRRLLLLVRRYAATVGQPHMRRLLQLGFLVLFQEENTIRGGDTTEILSR